MIWTAGLPIQVKELAEIVKSYAIKLSRLRSFTNKKQKKESLLLRYKLTYYICIAEMFPIVLLACFECVKHFMVGLIIIDFYLL